MCPKSCPTKRTSVFWIVRQGLLGGLHVVRHEDSFDFDHFVAFSSITALQVATTWAKCAGGTLACLECE